MAAAPHTLELDLDIERSASMPMEGKGVYARWDAAEGSMRVHSSTQTSTGVRAAVAARLGLPLGQGRLRRADGRRRLRREDRAPVARGGAGAVGGTRARPRGEVGRGPPRALRLLGARARPAAGGHGRLRRRRPAARPGRAVLARQRRLHAVRRSSCRSSPPPSCSVPTSPAPTACEWWSLYTNTVIVTPYRGAGRPQGVLRDGAHHRRDRRRARARPGRGAAAQLHHARRDALRPPPDLPGRPPADLRLRRLPGLAARS